MPPALRRRAASTSVLAATLLAFPGLAATAAPVPPGPAPSVPAGASADYIVALVEPGPGTAGEPHVAARAASSAAAARARAAGIAVTQVYGDAFTGYAARLTPAQAAALGKDPAVRYVAPDVPSTPNADQTTDLTWGLDRIDQERLPLSGSYSMTPSPGSGVTVFVVDTGINAGHQDFSGRMQPGFTAVADGRGTGDCHGHGTHVAGTVGGSTFGVAKGVTLVSVRVAGCNGSAASSRSVSGIDWIVREKRAGRIPGPAVINMSMGHAVRWDEWAFPVEDALNRAIDENITVVLAAGNDAAGACGHSPGRMARALTVGATLPSDQRAPFSNYGSCIDLFAPGKDIRSASHTSATGSTLKSGTSMAAPHVAGAVARLLEQYGPQQPGVVGSSLKRQATANVLADVGSGSPNLMLRVAAPTAAVVPHVLGSSCAVASAEVRAAGLVPRCVGTGTWVARQSPAAGTTVAPASTVTLTLSSGPIP